MNELIGIVVFEALQKKVSEPLSGINIFRLAIDGLRNEPIEVKISVDFL